VRGQLVGAYAGVTSSPCGADFVGLAFHVISLRKLAALWRNLIRNSILLH
jgi:hypothetical protein